MHSVRQHPPHDSLWIRPTRLCWNSRSLPRWCFWTISSQLETQLVACPPWICKQARDEPFYDHNIPAEEGILSYWPPWFWYKISQVFYCLWCCMWCAGWMRTKLRKERHDWSHWRWAGGRESICLQIASHSGQYHMLYQFAEGGYTRRDWKVLRLTLKGIRYNPIRIRITIINHRGGNCRLSQCSNH